MFKSFLLVLHVIFFFTFICWLFIDYLFLVFQTKKDPDAVERVIYV